jgi:hypothetical protein
MGFSFAFYTWQDCIRNISGFQPGAEKIATKYKATIITISKTFFSFVPY